MWDLKILIWIAITIIVTILIFTLIYHFWSKKEDYAVEDISPSCRQRHINN